MLENICDKSKCTGCMACVNICPKEAVVLKINERGFWYPEITHRCIECGKCINVCPQNDFKLKKNQYEVFAVWNKDNDKKTCAENNGYKVLVIWEYDYKQNKEDVIKKCIDFLNS